MRLAYATPRRRAAYGIPLLVLALAFGALAAAPSASAKEVCSEVRTGNGITVTQTTVGEPKCRYEKTCAVLLSDAVVAAVAVEDCFAVY